MSMTNITTRWHAPGDNSGEASQICIVFESALNSGKKPEIEEYLDATPGPNRSTLLIRLVMVELRHRFLAGEVPSLDEYVERFADERETIQELQAYWEQLRQEMERATAETLVTRTARKLGRFELRLKVGSGGFGEVWQAWDPELKRVVAVKTLDPDKTVVSDLNLARHEASVAAQLNHPNVVALYEYVEAEHETYLVSEFVEGTDLRSLIKAGPINFSKAVDICRHIARGLHQAHELGVVHRDIKPANILVSLRGQPKLADFGVAHWQGAEGTLRNDRELVGTTTYMSPEQAYCNPVVAQSDIYSLGVVLYEMLTGKPPFTGAVTDILMGHQVLNPTPPRRIDRTIPRDLETICLKMLAKKPRDRYRTAEELAEDLDRYTFNLPPRARRLNVFEKSWRRICRKPRQAAATAGTTTTLALCFSGLLLYSFPPQVDDGRRSVEIMTNPPGLIVNVFRRDDTTFLPQNSNAAVVNKTPDSLRLKPGHYLVSLQDPDSGRIVQVDRFVPEVDDQIVKQGTKNLKWKSEGNKLAWPAVDIIPEGTPDSLVLIEGGTVTMVDPANPAAGVQELYVPDFYISNREFSVEDLMVIRPHLRTAPEEIEYLLGYCGNDPLRPLFRDWALHWAEHYGCRLPTEIEYRYLTQQINVPDDWERSHGLRYENAPWDYLTNYPAVSGIATGLAEWTGSYPLSCSTEIREPQLLADPFSWGVVWGGNASVEELEGTEDREEQLRLIVKRFGQYRGLGFRLARSAVMPKELSFE